MIKSILLRIRKNTDGMSIPEVAIAAGIASVLALGALTLTTSVINSTRRAEGKTTWNNLLVQIRNAYSDPKICTATFGAAERATPYTFAPTGNPSLTLTKLEYLRAPYLITGQAVNGIKTISIQMFRNPEVLPVDVKSFNGATGLTWKRYSTYLTIKAGRVSSKESSTTTEDLISGTSVVDPSAILMDVYVDNNNVIQACQSFSGPSMGCPEYDGIMAEDERDTHTTHKKCQIKSLVLDPLGTNTVPTDTASPTNAQLQFGDPALGATNNISSSYATATQTSELSINSPTGQLKLYGSQGASIEGEDLIQLLAQTTVVENDLNIMNNLGVLGDAVIQGKTTIQGKATINGKTINKAVCDIVHGEYDANTDGCHTSPMCVFCQSTCGGKWPTYGGARKTENEWGAFDTHGRGCVVTGGYNGSGWYSTLSEWVVLCYR